MSGYIGNAPVPQATQTRQTFTATSGQTSFATVGYVAGGQFIQVYLNGVLLKLTDDYTAENGSDIVLTSGAATGDVLELITFADFTVNNQNFTGGLTVDGDVTIDNRNRLRFANSGVDKALIGINQGKNLYMGSEGSSSDPRIRFNGETSQAEIVPCLPAGGTTSGASGYLNLGSSTAGFKDLYLDGGIFLGGDGSANKINDYETGTWSSTVSGVTATTNTVSGTYTKIGDVIVINGSVTISGKTSGSGNANFSLPFAPKDADTTKFGLQFTYNDINTSFTYAAPYNGTATTFFYTSNQFALSGSGMGNGVIKFNGTYLTT